MKKTFNSADQEGGIYTPAVPSNKTANVGVWLPVVIGDMRRDTAGMPPEFTGMYLNLLMAMWQNAGQISSEESYLCRVSGGNKAQWIKYRQQLANLFEPDGDIWRHSGLREQLKKAVSVSESRKAAAKTAINARWSKQRSEQTNFQKKELSSELFKQIPTNEVPY